MVYRFDGDRVLRLIASGDLDAAQLLLDEAAKAAVIPGSEDVNTPEDFEAAMLDYTGAATVLEAAVILASPERTRDRVEANLGRAIVANRRADGEAVLKAIIEAIDDGVTLAGLSNQTFDAFSNLAYIAHASDEFQKWRVAMSAARTFFDWGDAKRARNWFARIPVEQNDNDAFEQAYRDLGEAIDAM